jgi:histidinol-phosphatase (PHP family)
MRGMNCDMHVHTEFSGDSDADMRKYCEIGKQKRIDVICFTDHVDFNKYDEGYGYYKPEQYFDSLEEVRKGMDLDLLSGIEFSEPHLYNEQLSLLAKYPYDFILGSVHWVGDMFPCQEVRDKITAGEFFSLYWKEVLRTVEQGGFDCLGHIDFPKRYYRELYFEEAQIIKIFETMHKQKIVLEINTSSLRKGLTTTMPDQALLELYKFTGGEFVTIGSDSHREEDLGEGIDDAKKLIRNLDLKQVIFRKRKRELV